MDDDDVRRGKLTVHRAFSEATAVLAGDAMHALAFDLLADEATHEDPFVRIELTAELARASGPHGLAGGQMLGRMDWARTYGVATTPPRTRNSRGASSRFGLVERGIVG